jgi:hypothetical protein
MVSLRFGVDGGRIDPISVYRADGIIDNVKG